MGVVLMSAEGDIPSTAMPSDTAFQYGSSGPSGAVGGARTLLNKQNFAAASPQNPGATGADNVLAVYSLPANTFDNAGRSVNVKAFGSFASESSARTVKIIFNPATAVVGSTVGTGGSTIASTGAYSTSGATAFSLEAFVTKDSSTANKQTSVNVINAVATTTPALIAPIAITATENAAILIAVTGNATTAATDIGLVLFEVAARC